MRADFFHRTWNRIKANQQVDCYTLDVPADADLATLLRVAYANRVPKGTHQTGVFEIQTDLGIWSRPDECRLDASTPRRLAACQFKTWAQLEVEEIACVD